MHDPSPIAQGNLLLEKLLDDARQPSQPPRPPDGS